MPELQSRFDQVMSDWLPRLDGRLGLAVSGGGDSMALLRLADRWARDNGIQLYIASVDHALREGSRAEADMVVTSATKLGWAGTVLTWHENDVANNLQATAREARQKLLSGWAASTGLQHIALGHTLDDQAETFLLRLARGSGLNGLAGIAPDTKMHGITWLRPLLQLRRDALRQFLKGIGQDWVEDPSNDDLRFDRVAFRQAMPQFAGLGLSAERLSKTAENLARARHALATGLVSQLDQLADATPQGSVRLNVRAIQSVPEELQLRLLAASAQWISGAPYAPRLEASKACLEALFSRKGYTFSGTLLSHGKSGAILTREPAPVSGWDEQRFEFDARWRVTGASKSIRILGADGLAQCADWRESGLTRQEAEVLPSLWDQETLIAAPFLREKQGIAFDLLRPASHLPEIISTH